MRRFSIVNSTLYRPSFFLFDYSIPVSSSQSQCKRPPSGVPDRDPKSYLVVAAAAVHAQQTDDIQEDVDEVQIEGQCAVDGSLLGHLGVACATQAEIDEKVAQARREGVLRREPEQLGDPVGYFAFFADPDGNTLELSWGQRVGLEVIAAGNVS